MKFIEDPKIHGLGCGDNSCRYVKPTGMATNGGCRCARNHGDQVERFLLRNYHQACQQILDLETKLAFLNEET